MSEESTFLESIQNSPTDESLQMVYADWLEERGDPRGEWLRIRSTLVTLSQDNTRRTELEMRLRDLRQNIDPAWLNVIELRLPKALATFLRENRQLECDEDACEAGSVTLLRFSELKLERFPVETGGSDFWEQDPHHPKANSYLVLGVNLIASCTGGYEPVGLLMWLPVEQRFAIWDSSHCKISVFGAHVNWERIVADPAGHIDAGWEVTDPHGRPMEALIPWLAHPYGKSQVYTPQPP